MRHQIEAAQEMLCRPMRVGAAMKVAFTMIALTAGLAAASAMAPKTGHAAPPVMSASNIKPVILSIDWQEQDTGASQLAETQAEKVRL